MDTNRLSPLLRRALPGTGILVTGRPGQRHRSWRSSLRSAMEGVSAAWQMERHLRVHVGCGMTVVIFAWACQCSVTEWLGLFVAIGLVIFAELMNTAIEQTVDLVVGLRPDPLAGRVKDIAAGCVLIATVMAIFVGGITFVPHIRVGFVTFFHSSP